MKINKTEQKKPLGLYIHIPFCARKCNYCDFLSMTAKEDMVKEYMKALTMEIKHCQGFAWNYEVNTIFIGGGTPSSIGASYIDELMQVVKENFSIMPNHRKEGLPEITIECNPGTLTREKLEFYKLTGINRLSIGLQSTQDDLLKKLGRIHTYEEFLNNYKMAREIGFQNINIDLMSALPGQTSKDWRDTLSQIIKLKPEHISAYSLIIEEGTPFFDIYGTQQGEELLPTEETDREIYALTKKYLKDAGYERYEISNYAINGYESRHNSSYWKGSEYLGLGLGSSSLLNNERFHNETDMEAYIMRVNQQESPWCQVEVRSREQQMEEFMFLGLRMMEGVSRKGFKEIFGVEIEEIYKEQLERFVEKDLLAQVDDRIYLTDGGIDVSNQVFVEFLLGE